MAERGPRITELTAISPLDGRYRNRVEDLAPHASEMAVIKTRVEVASRYVVALSDAGVARPFTKVERTYLTDLGPSMTLPQVERVKEIESTTRHDVKAMERAFREFVADTSLEDVTEMIHFGLTSEDVTNLSYRLMLDRATKQICVSALDEVVDELANKARDYRDIPMLARTHGQPAVPTTLGKEMANVAVRLNRQVRKIEDVKLTGKLTGAVGNFNAHVLAAPEVDWIDFSQEFVRSLGLEPNIFTTQINPYEDMIELFQAYQRANGVLLDIDQDMWRYISDGWFKQEVKAGEVGSSTMPQKVNPIDFENSEGNLQIANSLWEGMDRTLATSRLQRDLSNSTTVRNIGLGLGHGLLAYRNALSGLQRIQPDNERIGSELNDNWAILTEGVQTVLRRTGSDDPYSAVADFSRGQRIVSEDWQGLVDGLPVDEGIKDTLGGLTPATYIGNAGKLTDMALAEIANSRVRK